MQYILRKFKLLLTFYNKSLFFQPGLYFFDRNLSVIYRIQNRKSVLKVKDSLFENSIGEHNLLKKLLNNLLLVVFTPFLLVISLKLYISKNKYNGVMLIVNSDITSIKIFNFKEYEILCFDENYKDFKYNVDNLKYNKYFKTPLISNVNQEQQCYICEYIEFIPSRKLSLENHKVIISDYIDTIMKLEQKRTFNYYTFKTPIDKIENDFFPYNVAKMKTTFEEKIPIATQHGDFWSSNILYTDDNIYYIDFDKVDNKIFTYDLFYYFWKELLINNSNYLLKQYFNGEFDDYFSKYFNHFNEKFETNKKEYYFNQFLMYSYIDEKQYNNKKVLNNLELNYKKIIEMNGVMYENT